MTKQAVIAIVVGVLILVGAAGAFLYSKNQSAKKAAVAVVAMRPSPTSAGMMQQSIADIFSSGKNSKCTFNTTGTSGDVSGTVYVSGDKARGDFDMTANGKSSTTHMIRTGDTFYMWGDSLPTGMKMVMNINDFASKMQGNPQSASFDPSKKVDIKCATWTTDATLFAPPSNIKFTSIQSAAPTGAMMHTTGTPTQGASTGTTNQCNICTSLTGQAKSACLAQFHCQ